MGRRCCLVLLCSAMGLVCPFAVLPQTHTFTNVSIQVQVRFADDAAAPMGIVVQLTRPAGGVVAESETNMYGNCVFVPPKPDVYVVRASPPGFQDASARVDFQNSQSVTARLTLRPLPGQAPAADSADSSRAISPKDGAVPAPARDEYEAGRAALLDQDLDRGIAHLKKAIELHESFAGAYVLLGTAYNQQKNWKEAQAALEKAIEFDPDSEVAHFQLGGALNQLKDYPEAVRMLRRGLDICPDAPDATGAHFELAQAYFALGQWQDAGFHAAKVIDLRPDFARAHVLMANINLKKGDGLGAISEFQTYLRLEPNGPAAASVRETIPKIEAAMVLAKE